MTGTPREFDVVDSFADQCRDDVGGDVLSTPSARADRALRRVVELRERKLLLAQGLPATGATAEFARARARQAVKRAERARRSALCRHVAAEQAHTRAAAALEQAALSAVTDAECDAMQTAAERHRIAASEHHAEATGSLPTASSSAWPTPVSDNLLHQ